MPKVRVLACGMVAALSCAGAAAAATVPTIITWGPNQEHGQHPRRIFLSADSGPEFLNIHWNSWGKAKAVGHGTWSYKGSEAATMTLTGRVRCKGGKNYTYTHGVLRNDRGTSQPVHLVFPKYAPIKWCN